MKKKSGDVFLNVRRGIALILILAVCLTVSAGWAEPVKQETVKYGKVTEEYWQDEGGNLTAGPEGYARVTYSYEGSETTERYFDAEGNPYRMQGGYYGRTLTRDGKRQVTGIVYLDAEGKKALNDMGYARIRIDYTSFAEVKYLSYYGTGKGPVIVPSLGYASVKTEFRGKTMTRRTYLDPQGNAINTPLGYAAQVQRVNKKNQVLEISFEYADGSPATCADGWSRCSRELDQDGQVLSEKYYTADGMLTDRGAGYAWEETEYVSKNETRTTRYDLNGEKTEFPGGYTTLKQEWREDRVVRESYLNADGQQILNREGVGAVAYEYDYAGRITRIMFEDLNGATIPGQGGYCGYRDTLDEDGRLLTRVYLGADGQPTELADGTSEVRYTYNDAGQITGSQAYQLSGLQVP